MKKIVKKRYVLQPGEHAVVVDRDGTSIGTPYMHRTMASIAIVREDGSSVYHGHTPYWLGTTNTYASHYVSGRSKHDSSCYDSERLKLQEKVNRMNEKMKYKIELSDSACAGYGNFPCDEENIERFPTEEAAWEGIRRNARDLDKIYPPNEDDPDFDIPLEERLDKIMSNFTVVQIDSRANRLTIKPKQKIYQPYPWEDYSERDFG